MAFGLGGRVSQNIGVGPDESSASKILRQADGKLVVAGSCAGEQWRQICVVRYTAMDMLDGRVEADCVCDSDAIKARLWDTWTKEHQDTTVTTVTKVVKTRLPWWFYGALVLAALVALSRFYIKPF